MTALDVNNASRHHRDVAARLPGSPVPKAPLATEASVMPRALPHRLLPACLALLILLSPALALAEQAAQTPQEMQAQILFVVHNMWMLVATMLVFMMHLGFAMLEAGLTRAKNTVNILFKNTAIVSIGIVAYALVGFNLMYPGPEAAGQLFGFAGFGIGTDAAGLTSAYNPGYTYWTDFIFQAMFAATAATIVSGAVAERVKLSSFLIFSTIYVAFVYPVVGMWHWGGGWLKLTGFHDFAGSTIVHSVGGWAALSGALLVGPRYGKYKGGRIMPIMGHNLPLATMGAFLLWFGWFGFNGGSVLSADPGAISLVCVTTTLGAACGTLGAMVVSWSVQKKPDLTMILNGALAGLVSVTAGADVLTPLTAGIIGGVGGVLVVLVVIGVDRLRVDDPVGAISVHLCCGVWGTLAVGLFVEGKSFATQLLGVGAVGALCLPVSLALFWIIRRTLGLRVHHEEELIGLDLSEHGQEAYAGFQIFTTQ
jgi:ammonium transporter, Amt family